MLTTQITDQLIEGDYTVVSADWTERIRMQ